MKIIFRLSILAVIAIMPFMANSQTEIQTVDNSEWFSHLLGKTVEEIDKMGIEKDSLEWCSWNPKSTAWKLCCAKYNVYQGEHSGAYQLSFKKDATAPVHEAVLYNVEYFMEVEVEVKQDTTKSLQRKVINSEWNKHLLGKTMEDSNVAGRPKMDLLPQNMINYLGKVDRTQFEKIVGTPVGYESGFVVYEVENTYDEVVTAIRCFYRESDGKLISVKFGTSYYLAYWINFTHLPGYPKTSEEAKRLGMYLPKEDRIGRLYQINFRLKTFGCQIMDIRENPHYSTAVVNYHIVK